MAFEYGEQRDEQGNITHTGSWGVKSNPKVAMERIIENFRWLRDEGGVGGGTGGVADVQVIINVELATTENIVLRGIQEVDGETVKEDDLVLVKNQTDQTKNGVYFAQVGNWEKYNTPAVIAVISEGVKNRRCIYYLASLMIDKDVVYAPLYAAGDDLEINANGELQLKKSVAAGQYTKVTVNEKGIITAAENPTKLHEYNITNAYTKAEVDELTNAIQAALVGHIGNKENPHSVTCVQIGAETVSGAQAKADVALADAKKYTDDTKDTLDAKIEKVETEATNALKAHTENHENPHGVTCVQIGAETTEGAKALADKTLADAKKYTDDATVVVKNSLDAHVGDKTNPHNVNCTQIGAESTEAAKTRAEQTLASAKVYTDAKVSEVNESIKEANQTITAAANGYTDTQIATVNAALSGHIGNKGNPHNVTAIQVGAEVPSGAQAKADAALASAKKYTDDTRDALKSTIATTASITERKASSYTDQEVLKVVDRVATSITPSLTVTQWEPKKTFFADSYVIYEDILYRCLETQENKETFDTSKYKAFSFGGSVDYKQVSVEVKAPFEKDIVVQAKNYCVPPIEVLRLIPGETGETIVKNEMAKFEENANYVVGDVVKLKTNFVIPATTTDFEDGVISESGVIDFKKIEGVV